MAAGQVYSHSGKLGYALWVMPLLVIIGALAAGVLYGFLSAFNPLRGYISFLFPIGFGITLGRLIAYSARIAKCRSMGFIYLASTLSGLLAIYTSWAVFIAAIINTFRMGVPRIPILDLFLSPTLLWEIVLRINYTGWYEIHGIRPTGIALWIFWIIEALIIIGGSAYVATRLMKRWVFCENCDDWCEIKEDIARFAFPSSRNHQARIKGGDLSVLAELEPSTTRLQMQLRLDQNRCHRCEAIESVEFYRIWYDLFKRSGREKSEWLAGPFLLDAAEIAKLEHMLTAGLAPKTPPSKSPVVKRKARL